MAYFIHESSYIDSGVTIGDGTKIWHFTHVQHGASIGGNCTLGQNVNVGRNVKIGNGCKIGNHVSVLDGVTLEDDVYCGPGCVFINDAAPRAAFQKGFENHPKTLVKRGASIGANVTVLCGVTIGEYAMISPGSVVSKDVPDYTSVTSIPAQASTKIDQYGNPTEEQ